MPLAKRKPSTVGEILVSEFLNPLKLSQSALAAAMSLSQDQVDNLCNKRLPLTPDQATDRSVDRVPSKPLKNHPPIH